MMKLWCQNSVFLRYGEWRNVIILFVIFATILQRSATWAQGTDSLFHQQIVGDFNGALQQQRSNNSEGSLGTTSGSGPQPLGKFSTFFLGAARFFQNVQVMAERYLENRRVQDARRQGRISRLQSNPRTPYISSIIQETTLPAITGAESVQEESRNPSLKSSSLLVPTSFANPTTPLDSGDTRLFSIPLQATNDFKTTENFAVPSTVVSYSTSKSTPKDGNSPTPNVWELLDSLRGTNSDQNSFAEKTSKETTQDSAEMDDPTYTLNIEDLASHAESMSLQLPPSQSLLKDELNLTLTTTTLPDTGDSSETLLDADASDAIDQKFPFVSEDRDAEIPEWKNPKISDTVDLELISSTRPPPPSANVTTETSMKSSSELDFQSKTFPSVSVASRYSSQISAPAVPPRGGRKDDNEHAVFPQRNIPNLNVTESQHLGHLLSSLVQSVREGAGDTGKPNVFNINIGSINYIPRNNSSPNYNQQHVDSAHIQNSNACNSSSSTAKIINKVPTRNNPVRPSQTAINQTSTAWQLNGDPKPPVMTQTTTPYPNIDPREQQKQSSGVIFGPKTSRSEEVEAISSAGADNEKFAVSRDQLVEYVDVSLELPSPVVFQLKL